jgi:hypothetical protein
LFIAITPAPSSDTFQCFLTVRQHAEPQAQKAKTETRSGDGDATSNVDRIMLFRNSGGNGSHRHLALDQMAFSEFRSDILGRQVFLATLLVHQ